MRAIYTAPTVEAAELALKDLDNEWGRQYSGVLDVWRRAWNEFIPFLDYPAELRRIVYTTDEIVNPSLVAGCWGTHVPARPPRSLESPARSRGHGGAPAAQRGRTTLTPARTGVAFGGGGRGPTPSQRAGCGAVSPAAPRCPERALEVAPQWWRPRPPPTCRHRP